MADNKIADNKIADNKIADNKIADNKIADNKIADNKIAEDKRLKTKKAEDKKADDKKQDFIAFINNIVTKYGFTFFHVTGQVGPIETEKIYAYWSKDKGKDVCVVLYGEEFEIFCENEKKDFIEEKVNELMKKLFCHGCGVGNLTRFRCSSCKKRFLCNGCFVKGLETEKANSSEKRPQRKFKCTFCKNIFNDWDE
jgi:hypothetical protein